MRRLPVPRGRTRRLQNDEEQRLLDACDRGRTPLLRPLIILAIETAMRRGELLDLRWEHVDLKLCVAHLPLTKNGDSRDVPLSRRAVQTLEQLRADGVKHERVFPVTGNSVRLAFEHLRVRAGMLINRDTLADIKPSFENDTNIVPIPPEQSAFSNCEKVVERDVEVYRKKAQSICMHYGIRSANVVSYNAQFPATVKEQQAICGMFDHVALHSVRGRAGFGTSGTALIGAEDIAL